MCELTSQGEFDVFVAKLSDNGGNQPPNKPVKPSGKISGKVNVEYTYKTSTTDPDGDQVYYNWSWGDGTYSGWIGPYASGGTASASHTWTVKGNYNIKVKAKDIHNAESEWSDPLAVTMPLDIPSSQQSSPTLQTHSSQPGSQQSNLQSNPSNPNQQNNQQSHSSLLLKTLQRMLNLR